jgi:hypothetical protein
LEFAKFVDEGQYTFHGDVAYMVRLTDEQLQPIREEVNKIKSDFTKYNGLDARKTLAGNLAKEFSLIDTRKYIEKDIIMPVVNYWHGKNGLHSVLAPNTEHRHFAMTTLWVNFQKKTEFNPLHNHSGVYSFVLWLDIPYTYEEENNRESSIESNKPVAGCFEFVYPSMEGIDTMTIPVDKTYNGVLAVFRSNTKHLVYPFYTSDDYRITVSGNVAFDLNERKVK